MEKKNQAKNKGKRNKQEKPTTTTKISEFFTWIKQKDQTQKKANETKNKNDKTKKNKTTQRNKQTEQRTNTDAKTRLFAIRREKKLPVNEIQHNMIYLPSYHSSA